MTVNRGGEVAGFESSTQPGALGDYVAAAWRRRFVVATAVVLCAVLGAVVVPFVTSNGRVYAASQRVDIKAFGSEKAPASTTGGRAGANASGARYADPAVMAVALKALDTSGKAGASTRTTNKAVRALSKLSASPV